MNKNARLITGVFRLKNMLEMNSLYRKTDAKALNIKSLNNE